MPDDTAQPSAYLTPPTIVYAENEKVGDKDEFCSILVSTQWGHNRSGKGSEATSILSPT